MSTDTPTDRKSETAAPQQIALPGRGGLMRVWKAFLNSMRGFSHALSNEAAVKQEMALAIVALPVSFFLAGSVPEWVALVGVFLLMFCAELLNTAVEKLCDHVTPMHHDDIRNIKDVASAAVFCARGRIGLVWGAVARKACGISTW